MRDFPREEGQARPPNHAYLWYPQKHIGRGLGKKRMDARFSRALAGLRPRPKVPFLPPSSPS